MSKQENANSDVRKKMLVAVGKVLPELLPYSAPEPGSLGSYEWVMVERKRDPSVYLFDRDRVDIVEGLTGAEAVALHAAGVFGALSRGTPRGCKVNEHAAHAFYEFLAEATTAWEKYQQRLADIPAIWNSDLE